MSFGSTITFTDPESTSRTFTRVGNGTPTTSLYRHTASDASGDAWELLIRQTLTKTRHRSEFRLSLIDKPSVVPAADRREPIVVYTVIDGPIDPDRSAHDYKFVNGCLKVLMTDTTVGQLLNGEL